MNFQADELTEMLLNSGIANIGGMLVAGFFVLLMCVVGIYALVRMTP